MLGAYVANAGCEYQAIAFGILAQCGGTPHPAERDALATRMAERDPR